MTENVKSMDLRLRETYIEKLMQIQAALFISHTKLAEELGIGYKTLKKMLQAENLMRMCPSVMRKIKRYVDRNWIKISHLVN